MRKFSKSYPVSTILISKYQLSTSMNRIVIVQKLNIIQDELDLFCGKILLTDEDENMIGEEILFSFTYFKLF